MQTILFYITDCLFFYVISYILFYVAIMDNIMGFWALPFEFCHFLPIITRELGPGRPVSSSSSFFGGPSGLLLLLLRLHRVIGRKCHLGWNNHRMQLIPWALLVIVLTGIRESFLVAKLLRCSTALLHVGAQRVLLMCLLRIHCFILIIHMNN